MKTRVIWGPLLSEMHMQFFYYLFGRIMRLQKGSDKDIDPI